MSEEDQGKIFLTAREAYTRLIQIQFQLCYHAHISISDMDNMAKYEYEAFFDQLKEQKEAEKEKMEEAARSAKSGGRG